VKLAVIDQDEYRQYQYWQFFQKLILPCAAGFSVGALLLGAPELQRLCEVVAGLLWALFIASAVLAHLVARHMTRELPESMQSLLLFSSDSAEPQAPVTEIPPAANG
jgi:hypothetical protein